MLNYIVFAIILNASSGIVRSPCPLACNCDLERGVVDCPYGGLNALPQIPVGTKHVRIKGGEFRKLQGPSSCQNYSNVTHLELVGIESIDENALECMPNLQFLAITGKFARNIPNNTLQHVPNLLNVTFDGWKQRDFITMLCTIPSLQVIDLYLADYIEPGTLNCLGHLNNLSHVDLCGNIMYGSLSRIVRPLQNVSIYISLACCNILGFLEDTFSGFKVSILDLSFNKIGSLRTNSFTQMPNLIKLKLAGNRIFEIRNWLGHLYPLQEIDLQFQVYDNDEWSTGLGHYVHKAKGGTISHDFFSYMDILPKDMALYNVENHVFPNLHNLEILQLGYNNIGRTKLSTLLLEIAYCPLRILSLSGIPLHTLNKTFQAFHESKLEKLYLSTCKISKILPKTFKNFPGLQELDLSNNEIQSFSYDTFHDLTNLTTLTLHHNYLKTFYAHINVLRKLDIHNNQIVNVHIDFENIFTLTMIDLSNNQLTIYWGLENLTSLRILRLSSNSLLLGINNQFPNDLSDLNLANNILPSWKNLQRLTGIKVSQPLWDGIQKLQGLKRLNLTQNPIGRLHSNEQKKIWANLTQLRSLDISRCHIKALAPGLFSSLIHLKVLNLSSNQIPSINPSSFQGVTHITELYLHSNVIRYVNFRSFVYTPHLRLLSLANNPLLCTCDVLWISQAVRTHDLVYIHNAEETVCNSPASVENVKIKELNLTLSDCETQWSLLILKPLGIGTASILALVFLYIAWYYRWHIRYTLFLARAGRGRFQETCDDHEYLYDAFVAYSIEDLPWVKQQMLPNVDVDYFGLGGFKLCLHHRDWLVGVDITENIVKSIAESRRTILVLSKDFAASYWCRFELAMAHMKLDVEGGNKSRLMVILLNDIPPKLLNPRLVHILGTKTYIAWPQDPNEHQLFWKTIRKSLRKELLYTTKE